MKKLGINRTTRLSVVIRSLPAGKDTNLPALVSILPHFAISMLLTFGGSFAEHAVLQGVGD